MRKPASNLKTNFEQKFLLVVNLVRQHPIEDLVSKLRSGKIISKDQVIRESMCLKLQVLVFAEYANMKVSD